MGRRKVPVKRIEDNSSRHVTFSKRRKGLIKKASEISVLCDADVALFVISGGGRFYEFCSNDGLSEIIQRYHSRSETELTVPRSCEEERRCANSRTSSELVHVVERLEEPPFDQLSVADLLQLEEEIAHTLIDIRSRKTRVMMDSVLALQDKEKVLQEDNNGLNSELGALKDDVNKAKKNVGTNSRLQLLNLF